jgi:hypothetical protein
MNELRQTEFLSDGADTTWRVSFSGSVMQRSLLNVLQTEQNEEFKDAIADEEQAPLNEWELSVKLTKNHIDVNC